MGCLAPPAARSLDVGVSGHPLPLRLEPREKAQPGAAGGEEVPPVRPHQPHTLDLVSRSLERDNRFTEKVLQLDSE